MALLSRLGRRLLPLAVVLTAFASVVRPRARPATAAPDTEEPKAYILVDADRGQVIASKNEHEPLLTASTAGPPRSPRSNGSPSTARSPSTAARRPAGLKISMLEGQVWKLNDVLHALLMESANDAAFALAERASGSVEQFAQDANTVASGSGPRTRSSATRPASTTPTPSPVGRT